MFRWCSYCQVFIGESEPKHDFSLTHGICHNCKDTQIYKDFDPESISPIKNFYHNLQDKFREGKNIDVQTILADAQKLNIKSKRPSGWSYSTSALRNWRTLYSR